MPCYVVCHHDHVTDHCSQSSASDLMLSGCPSPAATFLSDHPQDVIGQNCKFQHQLIGLKLAERQSFQIHVDFDLAVELLAFTREMVGPDDFYVAYPQVCPPGISFYVAFQKQLPIFINGTVYDLIPDKFGRKS